MRTPFGSVIHVERVCVFDVIRVMTVSNAQNLLERLADSTGRCNTFVELLSGCVEAERLARPPVQLSRDGVELQLQEA